MSYEITIDSRVLDDFIQAFEYYNNISEVLSESFRLHFLYALNRVGSYPKNYFKISGKFRRITLKKFPYMIVYEVNESAVIVRALFHQNSKPSKIKKL